MNTKKIVLGIGLGAMIILILLGVGESKLGLSCSFRTNERISPSAGGFGSNGEYQPGLVWDKVEWCEPFAFALMPFILILLLSLITYKMHDDVFRAWWRFARWFAPVIIVVTILLENAGGGGGIGIGGAVSTAFDILILGILYAILGIVSIIQIARAYLKTK